MWYSTNYNILTVLLLLVGLRKPELAGFMHALIAPVATQDYEWNQQRERNLYRIEHSFQVCYMRGALNDGFDPELRRIEIDSTAASEDRVYFFTPPEGQPQYEPIHIPHPSEVQNIGANFRVFVPAEIYAIQEFEIKAMIDFYRLAGKKYTIVQI